MTERLTVDDVACWVLKSRTAPQDIASDWLPGHVQTLTRCLRRSYRLELMRPGQPCLLWVSGRTDPGVQAIGTLASAPGDADPGDGPGADGFAADGPAAGPAVSVSLLRLELPLARQDLLSDHVLAGAEVLRMPAGSNPSFLGAARWAALRELLSSADRARAGGVWAAG